MEPASPVTIPREFTIRLPPDEDLMQVPGVSFLQIGKDVTRMKQRVVVLLLCALLAASASGCAETPETAPVVQKDQEQLIETAGTLEDGSATIEEQTAVPERVQASFTDSTGVLIVEMDAEVMLPETETAQIYQMYQHELTQADVNLWREVLLEDTPVYTVESLAVYTRSELEAQLLEKKQALAEALDSGDVLSEANEAGVVTFDSEADRLQMAVDTLEDDMKTAPESRTPEPADTQLDSAGELLSFAVENDAGNGLRAIHATLDDGLQALVYSNQGQNRTMQEDWFRSWQYTYLTYDEIVQLHNNGEISNRYELLSTLPEPKLSLADAQLQADALVAALGIDLIQLQAEAVLGEYEDDFTGEANCFKAWRFHYGRAIDGIPVTYTGVAMSQPEDYTGWYYEDFYIVVNDIGIVEAGWVSPYDIGESQTENCKLMEFSAVMDIFEKMMLIVYDPAIRGDAQNRTTSILSDSIHVTDVQFGYTRITGQNAGNLSGLMVPTWTFFGTEEMSIQDDDSSTWDSSYGRSVLLTVNAIDGSIIDPGTGY